jgi:DNA-binding protein HU-beta
MNKSELIRSIAASEELPKATVAKVIERMLENIRYTLAIGDKVSLVNFGTFSTRHRAEKKGRNPRTGEPVDIKATNVPVFKAGKLFKTSVAESV